MKNFIINLFATASLLSSSLPACCMEQTEEAQQSHTPAVRQASQKLSAELLLSKPNIYLLPYDPELVPSDASIILSAGDIGLFCRDNELYLHHENYCTEDLKQNKPFIIEIDLFDFCVAGGTSEKYAQILQLTQQVKESQICGFLAPQDEKVLLDYGKNQGLANQRILTLSTVCKSWKTFFDPLFINLVRPSRNRYFFEILRNSKKLPTQAVAEEFEKDLLVRFKNLTSLTCSLHHPKFLLSAPNLTALNISMHTVMAYGNWQHLSNLTNLKVAPAMRVKDTFTVDFPNLKNLQISTQMLRLAYQTPLSFFSLKNFHELKLLDVRSVNNYYNKLEEARDSFPNVISKLSKKMTVLR